MCINDKNNTKYINLEINNKEETKEKMIYIIKALAEKGYSPTKQLSGYVMSGDPTYITSYLDARKYIQTLEREEIIELMIEMFIENTV